MSWLVPFGPVGDRPVLVCLPQAGSGCGVFREWQHVFGDSVSVVGVQLPGRENRFTEPPVASFAAAVTAIADELAALPVPPTVLFGHSFGGLLAYEVARVLPPAATVVAASRPPEHSGAAGGSIGAADGLAAAMKSLADKELDEDLRELALAVLVSDAELSATYAGPVDRSPGPLHAWVGEDDDVVTEEGAQGWRAHAELCEVRRFAGGHDFCFESTAVTSALCELLYPVRREGVLCGWT